MEFGTMAQSECGEATTVDNLSLPEGSRIRNRIAGIVREVVPVNCRASTVSTVTAETFDCGVMV